MNIKKNRKERREQNCGIKLLNKLLFEFIDFESRNSIEENDKLYFPASIRILQKELHEEWKYFCNKVKVNPKKRLGYKIEAFIKESDKHLHNREESVWTINLVNVLNDNYGIKMPVSTASKYIDLNINAAVIAKEIYNSISTMHKIEIPEINFTKEIPEDITEMTASQFEFMAGQLYKVYNGELTTYDFKTAMALKFLGVKYTRADYAKLPAETKQDVGANIYGLTELLDFFFVSEGNNLKFNTSFVNNLVPQLTVQKVLKYYGPADALTDITFMEYKDANAHYQAYLKNKNEADLNMLCAILYRPARIPFIWKKKCKYRYKSALRRARKIAKLPIAQRFAIYLFYMACEDFLREGEINVDGNKVNLGLLYETTLKEKQHTTEPKYNANTGLAGVALSLAGTGIFGSIDKVYKQNLYDVLVLLLKQRVEYLNKLEGIK